MKTALVIGATGLVGSHLLEQLTKNDDFGKIVVLTRRPLTLHHPKAEIRQIDFDAPDPSKISGDIIFCAIGTTIRKAGSKENQYRIDCEYPARLAELAKKNGAEKFVLVSSIGASPRSGNFYLRTKGELEEKLRALDYASLVILRPSIILGKRQEFRLGEKIAILIASILKPVMTGPLRKYRGVEASDIAARMLKASLENGPKVQIIASEEITVS